MTNFQVVHDGQFGFPFYLLCCLSGIDDLVASVFLMDEISALECFPPNYRWFFSAMKLPV